MTLLAIQCIVYTDGKICLDILQNNWSPLFTVSTVLKSIQVFQSQTNYKRMNRVCWMIQTQNLQPMSKHPKCMMKIVKSIGFQSHDHSIDILSVSKRLSLKVGLQSNKQNNEFKESKIKFFVVFFLLLFYENMIVLYDNEYTFCKSFSLVSF